MTTKQKRSTGIPACVPSRNTGKNACAPLLAIILTAFLSRAQTNIVYYGAETNALNVVFADTTLSVSNQTLIVADLNLCLQSGWGKEIKLGMGHDDPAFVAHLSYSWQCPHYDPFPEDIVATPNGHALQITQELSDAYTNDFAWAWAASHSNIVVAGYAFVEFLSSTNFPNIQANDWPNYYLVPNKTDAELIAIAHHHISAFSKYTFYPPSIRGFGTYEFAAEPGIEYVIMMIPNSHTPYFYGTTFAIYHDERWKIMDIRWIYNFDAPQYEEEE